MQPFSDDFIQLTGPLFERVMQERIFDDPKTFVDSIPNNPPEEIMASFFNESSVPGFDLKAFVENHFTLPSPVSEKLAKTPESMDDYINAMWPILTREIKASSPFDTLLTLPHPHLVPGGRFRECFYWDSYFTLLGLIQEGCKETVSGCVDNFHHLIQTYGFIPNGTRQYFLSRSQPPFFALILELTSNCLGKKALESYHYSLEKEHLFWLKERDYVKKHKVAKGRSAYIHHPVYKGALSRYYDPINEPRPEAFYKEAEYGKHTPSSQQFFKNLRAVCESGWDFSTRFLEDKELKTVNALALCPVDLHCLLYTMEKRLYSFYKARCEEKQKHYNYLMLKRREAIETLFFGGDFFYDFNWRKNKRSEKKTLAGMFPLFVKLASNEQAAAAADTIKRSFLKEGGFVTTLGKGHQWDWPNGWAPLQWIAIVGLVNYGYKELAQEGAQRWLKMVEKHYKKSGTLLEKYNVVSVDENAHDGEYSMQQGFGWTNGVTKALKWFVQTGELP